MFATTLFAALSDTQGVKDRKQARSKYGAKRPEGSLTALGGIAASSGLNRVF